MVLHPRDSAQTIAREVGFRFENIKDLFFKEFIKKSEGEEMPETFKLVENYRTHNGILGVANGTVLFKSRTQPWI